MHIPSQRKVESLLKFLFLISASFFWTYLSGRDAMRWTQLIRSSSSSSSPSYLIISMRMYPCFLLSMYVHVCMCMCTCWRCSGVCLSNLYYIMVHTDSDDNDDEELWREALFECLEVVIQGTAESNRTKPISIEVPCVLDKKENTRVFVIPLRLRSWYFGLAFHWRGQYSFARFVCE